MSKIAYKDIFKRDNDGKITAYGKEYASIKEVPDKVLDIMTLDLIKEQKNAFKLARPFKIIEKIGWAFIYVSAAAAIASWCVDGQAKEVFQGINLWTLIGSAPEISAALIYRMSQLKKIKKIDKIYDILDEEESRRQWEMLEKQMDEEDSTDGIIYSDDFREI